MVRTSLKTAMSQPICSYLILLIPLLLVPLIVCKWLHASYTTSRNQPPSPKKLPILGNLHQLGSLPHRSLHKLSQQYGPLMLLHLGNVPVLVASSADAAREIMKTHDLIFSNRPKNTIADRLLYGSRDVAFAPYGEYWRQIKSLCVLHLLSNKRVQSFRNVREEETSLMIEKVSKLISSSSSSSSGLINLGDVLTSLTNDIVCRVALGRKYGDDGEIGKKFKLMLKEFTELIGTFNIGDYIPWLAWLNFVNGLDGKVKKVGKELDEFLEGVVEEQRNKKKSEDIGVASGGSHLVDILLDIQRQNAFGFHISNETVKAIIWDMFAAGTDTTHSVLVWAMSELLRKPETMQNLQNEVRQIAQTKSEICEDDLVHMNYLKAVIKETLRLHAPVPLLVPREAAQDINLMGYDVKAGTQVLINAWSIGRDPNFWENSGEFLPERFLNSTIDFKGFNFVLVPFGAGRRGCPGIGFAVSVNELALANLVHKFDFALPGGLKEEGLDVSEANGITVGRKYPLLVVATPHGG